MCVEQVAGPMGSGWKGQVQGVRRRARRGGHLRGPQIELLEGRQFDEVLGAGTGDVGEGQAEVLQVSKGAGAQQAGQVRILQWAA